MKDGTAVTPAETPTSTADQTAVEREVRFVAEPESIVGAWHLSCPTCPLWKHQDALGVKREQCAFGLQTNIQGAVVMGTCKHYLKDSISGRGVGAGALLFLQCRKGDE